SWMPACFPGDPGSFVMATALVDTTPLPATLDRLSHRVTVLPEAHESIEVHAPATGQLLGTVPKGTPDDIREAVRRARKAQEDWFHRTVAERAAPILRFHDLIIERQDEVLDLIQLESGKARKHAFEEVADTAIVARYYSYHAEGLLAPRRR